MGGSLGLGSDYGRRLMFWRSWLWIPEPYRYWMDIFHTKLLMWVWKDQIKWKEAGDGLFCKKVLKYWLFFLLKSSLNGQTNSAELQIYSKINKLKHFFATEPSRDGEKSKWGIPNSVTRWCYYFSLFGHLQQIKFAQYHKTLAKVGLKCCQILNKPSIFC